MPRFHATAVGPVAFTAQEELDRNAEEVLAALPKVPQSVQKRQLLKALINASLDDAAIAALAGGGQQGKLDRADWAELTTVNRNSAVFAKIALALSLTPTAVDNLFIAASTINGG